VLTGLLIFIGGGIGSLARWWVSEFVAWMAGDRFGALPLGTLIVNVTGSFIIGFFATLTATEGRWLMSGTGRLFFMTGVCGGYTTFSSFSLQTLSLARNEKWFAAGANVVLSVVLCLFGVWLGHVVAAGIHGAKSR
jgi:CrcB protein